MGHDRGLGALAADDLPGTVFGHQHGLALGAAHHQRLAGPEPGDAAVHAAQLGQREAIAACNGGARLAAAHTVHQRAGIDLLVQARTVELFDQAVVTGMALRHQQPGTGQQVGARRDAVGAQQFRDGQAGTSGHPGQVLAALHGVRVPGDEGLALGRMGRHGGLEPFDAVDRNLEGVGARGRDDRAVVCRVEFEELGLGHAGKLRRQLQVDRAGLFDRDEVGLVGQLGQGQAQPAGVLHDVLDGQQLGHVVAGFGRHAQVGIVGRAAGPLVGLHGAVHGTFTPVVRGQRQEPVVAVHFVDGLQVVQRGTGGGFHVAAVVHPPVLVQVVLAAGGGDELPEAGCLGRRHGGGVHGTFDEGQQGQLGGHAAALDLLDDMVQIARAPAEHALQVFGAREVILFVLGHQRGIQLGHGKAGTNAPPQVVADHHLGAGVVTLGQLRGVQFTHGVAFGHDGRLAVAGGGAAAGMLGRYRGAGGQPASPQNQTGPGQQPGQPEMARGRQGRRVIGGGGGSHPAAGVWDAHVRYLWVCAGGHESPGLGTSLPARGGDVMPAPAGQNENERSARGRRQASMPRSGSLCKSLRVLWAHNSTGSCRDR